MFTADTPLMIWTYPIPTLAVLKGSPVKVLYTATPLLIPSSRPVLFPPASADGPVHPKRNLINGHCGSIVLFLQGYTLIDFEVDIKLDINE